MTKSQNKKDSKKKSFGIKQLLFAKKWMKCLHAQISSKFIELKTISSKTPAVYKVYNRSSRNEF